MLDDKATREQNTDSNVEVNDTKNERICLLHVQISYAHIIGVLRQDEAHVFTERHHGMQNCIPDLRANALRKVLGALRHHGMMQWAAGIPIVASMAG